VHVCLPLCVPARLPATQVHTQAFPRATGHTGSKESLAVPSHFTISSLQQQRAHASPACARDADWPTPPQHPRSILSGTGAEGAQHGLDGPSHRPTSRHSGADGVEGGSAGAGGSGSGGSGFLRRSVEKFVGELVLGNVAKGELIHVVRTCARARLPLRACMHTHTCLCVWAGQGVCACVPVCVRACVRV